MHERTNHILIPYCQHYLSNLLIQKWYLFVQLLVAQGVSLFSTEKHSKEKTIQRFNCVRLIDYTCVLCFLFSVTRLCLQNPCGFPDYYVKGYVWSIVNSTNDFKYSGYLNIYVINIDAVNVK